MKQPVNIMMMYRIVFLAFSVLLSLAIISCEVGSADSVTRAVNIIIEGVYSHPDDEPIVPESSGDPIMNLHIFQNGDVLEAVDNHGIHFVGTVGTVIDSQATVTLNGSTTAGAVATISGTITKSGTTATLRGTWIEPDHYSTVYAVADVLPDTSETNQTYTADCNTNNYQGCCSSHGGISLDGSGCVTFDSNGHVRCLDGTSSPTCTKR